MRDYIRLPRCTVQRRQGDFCDRPTHEDMPFPICLDHALKLYLHMSDEVRRRALGGPEERAAAQARMNDRDARRRDAQRAQSVVYYLRLGQYIKIGYTENMQERLKALRVYDDTQGAVLATEPGGRREERARHLQFADLRVNRRREDFKAEDSLMRHIEAVRARYGPPVITGYVHVP